MEQSEFIQFSIVGEGGDKRGVLTFNNPEDPGNTLTRAICEKFIEVLEYIKKEHSDLRGLFITSKRKHFCTGVSIEEHFPGEVEITLPVFHKLLFILATFPIPTIALIYRGCVGGGLELARACRWVVALNPVDNKLRLSLPEINIGCYPPFALAAFPRLTDTDSLIDGLGHTILFLLTGQVLKGEDSINLHSAYIMGLINDRVSGTPEEVIESFEFGTIKNPPISELFNNPLIIDVPMITKALADGDTSKISTDILNLASEALIRCAEKRILKSALHLAERTYLSTIAKHPDYVIGLTAALKGEAPVFEKTGMPCQSGESGG